MTPTIRRALASAAIMFALAYTGRVRIRRVPQEDPWLIVMGPIESDENFFEEHVLTVVGLRQLILDDPSVVKGGDGGSLGD